MSTAAYEKHFPHLAQSFRFMIPLGERQADCCPDFILIVLVFRHLRFELMQTNADKLRKQLSDCTACSL